MKKLNSKLFENFKENEIGNTSFIVGGKGGISQKKDCNASSYDADSSSWRQDSDAALDTVRGDDGCNDLVASSYEAQIPSFH